MGTEREKRTHPPELNTESQPTPKRPLDFQPTVPDVPPAPARMRANSILLGNTKLAAACCTFGVLVGVFSMWMLTGPVSNAPTITPAALIPSDQKRDESTLQRAASTSPVGLPSRAEKSPGSTVALKAMPAKPQGTAGTISPQPGATQTVIADRQTIVPTRRSPVPTPRAVTAVRSNRAAATSFVGALALSSEPQGARVSIDGEIVGVTPLVMTGVKAGSRVVRVTIDGHQPWSSAVRVVANQRNVVTARLLSVPEPASP
jgi:PEGA domain